MPNAELELRRAKAPVHSKCLIAVRRHQSSTGVLENYSPVSASTTAS